jgi:protein TonB
MQTSLTNRSNRIGGGLAGSVALHGSLAALLLGWTYLHHPGQNWGDATTAGAIQATMVTDIPLPPKAPADPNNVLATDAPSPAPIAPAPKTVDTPRPEAIPIPMKNAKPAKLADKTTPPPPLHPQPVKVDPSKAQTGQATGLPLAMSSIQTKAGTTSVDVSDSAFGTRFAYYVKEINQKVALQWYTGMLDAQAPGHRVYIVFDIDRDGSVSHIQYAKRSGDNSLDQTGLSAVQHVDTFPPLPEAYTGSHLTVTYYFDPPPRP